MLSKPIVSTRLLGKDLFIGPKEQQPGIVRDLKFICNLVRMKFNPNEESATQYSLEIQPEIDANNVALRRKILRAAGKEMKGYYDPYFSTGATLFSSAKNPQKELTFTVTVDSKEFKLIIKKTDFKVDLNEIKTTSDANRNVRMFIDVIIKQIFQANNGLVKFDDRSFYNYTMQTNIQGRAISLPGFATASVITTTGLYLRINDKNKLISNQTALQKINQLKEKFKNGSYEVEIKQFFNHMSVMANYGTHRVYTIDDISFEKNLDNVRISIKGGDGNPKEVTLFEYYKLNYPNVPINDRNQPLLMHKVNPDSLEVVYLVPELMMICGLDDDRNDVQDPQEAKRKLASRGKLTPPQKLQKLETIQKILYNKEKKSLPAKQNKPRVEFPSADDVRRKWGLGFEGFLHFNGRTLEPPRIIFADGEQPINRGRFRQGRAVKPVHFSNREWVCYTTTDSKKDAEQMVQSLLRSARNLGINIEEPQIVAFNVRRASDFVEELRQQDLNHGKKLALVVLSRYTKHYYPDLKKFFYGEPGLPCQMVHTDKKGQNLSYYSNVLAQMVVKARGELHSINLDNKLKSTPSMIVGLDSSRAPQNQIKFVMSSSYNCNYSNYFTESATCPMSDKKPTLQTLVKNAIDFFSRTNAPEGSTFYPKMMFVYRNGGNDKQKVAQFQEELPAFQEECKKIGCKLVFISVNKKTDLKFFEETNRGLQNPQNGTIIDSDVVSPDYCEFYLQPQFVNSGTATPVHYHCLYDETNIPLNILENMTYRQTYYYWNWPGPIRTPAALKYAEMLNAFQSRYLKESKIHANLRSSPYFI